MAKITALVADAAVLDTDLCVTVEDPSGTPVTKKATWATIGTLFAARTESPTNKTFTGSTNVFSIYDANLSIVDNGDPTKIAQFQCSGITAGQTRTISIPDASGTVLLRGDTATVTNKSLSGASNTFTNVPLATAVTGTLPAANGGLAGDASAFTGVVKAAAGVFSAASLVNADVSASAAIAVSKLAPGSNGQVLQTTGGVTVWGAAPGGGSPGGSDTQLQWNNAGAFAGLTNWVWNAANSRVRINSAALELRNPAGTFGYIFTSAALAADRVLNFPLLTAADTLAVLALAQTFTNKTLVAASNTVTDTSAAAEDLFRHNGTRFVRFAKGSNNTVLTVNGSGALAYATIVNANVDAAAAIAGTKVSPDFGSQNVVTTGRGSFGALRLTGITGNASTGTLNDVSLGGNRIIRFTNAVGPTVTGFDATGIAEGDVLVVYAAAASVAFTNEAGTSTAANRITLAFGTTITLNQGTFTTFIYLSDGTNSRWRHQAATAI